MTPGSEMEFQTMYRLKNGSLSRWAGDLLTDICVYEGCAVFQPHTPSHWFWACREAIHLWEANLQLWALMFGRPWFTLTQELYSLQLEELPRHGAHLLVDSSLSRATQDLHREVLPRVLQHA